MKKGEKTNVASRGVVRVQAEKCATCIFKPGNKMDLRRGRLKDMVEGVRYIEGVITCHETMGHEENAVCRGQYDSHKTPLLQLADAMGVIEWTDIKEDAVQKIEVRGHYRTQRDANGNFVAVYVKPYTKVSDEKAKEKK